MSPEDKEAVLKALRANGRHTLMCGDGANDVGALKQAHVGLALLSGFGDANTKKAGAAELAAMAEAAEKAGDVDRARAARAAQQEKAAEAAKKLNDLKLAQERWKMEVAATRAELVELEKKYLEEELKNFENVSFGPFKAMRAASSRLYAEQQRRTSAQAAHSTAQHASRPPISSARLQSTPNHRQEAQQSSSMSGARPTSMPSTQQRRSSAL
jgi:cation-transporting ATPase 13A1